MRTMANLRSEAAYLLGLFDGTESVVGTCSEDGYLQEEVELTIRAKRLLRDLAALEPLLVAHTDASDEAQ